MPVDFKYFEDCKQQQLMISNVEAVHPKIKDINALHFFLNIDVLFPPAQITNLLSESLEEHQSHEFSPMHLIVKQLNKLRTFSSKAVFHFITKMLGLNFDKIIDKTTPIFAQWTYLHWFLQFMSLVALFPVKGGHCTLSIMKFMSGMQLDEPSPNR